MTPLRICFLWHQHQPDYRAGDRFFTPWVRMHATKDYINLPLIMADYSLKHTINLVPSMIMQLDEYLAGRKDPIDRLAELNADDYTPEDKLELHEWISTVQRPTMTESLPALNEIIDTSATDLTTRQITDALVLLHLAWIGPIHRHEAEPIQLLITKAEGFTTNDLDIVRAVHLDIIGRVSDTLSKLEQEGNIEISVTPFHHPILPLLCNSDDSLQALPDTPAIMPAFTAREDAEWHVREAKQFWETKSGTTPRGMWPAEGSISNDALSVLAEQGVCWTASDEGVLKNSIDYWSRVSPYRVYEKNTEHGPIKILFRDHSLSDAIGFEYATWDPQVAASNFVDRLLERREAIIRDGGEGALADAVIPIMLDGENCWEFYPENGEPFLRALFSEIERRPEFLSTTCAEAIQEVESVGLDSVVAGSWINASFDVWMGTETKNAAWSLVRAAREEVINRGLEASLMEKVYTLEASDWYWWYDDRHQAPHKPLFDEQFRAHLRDLYTELNIEPEVDLSVPLYQMAEKGTAGHDSRIISYGNNTMHDANAIIKNVTLDTNDNWQRITFEQQRAMTDSEEVVATIKDRFGNERRCAIMAGETLFQSELHDEGFDRDEHNNVRVFLRATTEWSVTIDEQREGGSSHQTTVDLKI